MTTTLRTTHPPSRGCFFSFFYFIGRHFPLLSWYILQYCLLWYDIYQGMGWFSSTSQGFLLAAKSPWGEEKFLSAVRDSENDTYILAIFIRGTAFCCCDSANWIHSCFNMIFYVTREEIIVTRRVTINLFPFTGRQFLSSWQIIICHMRKVLLSGRMWIPNISKHFLSQGKVPGHSRNDLSQIAIYSQIKINIVIKFGPYILIVHKKNVPAKFRLCLGVWLNILAQGNIIFTILVALSLIRGVLGE